MNAVYSGEISVGSGKGQEFEVQFDTGSTITWVPCDCSDCGDAEQLDYEIPKDMRHKENEGSVKYAKGYVEGYWS